MNLRVIGYVFGATALCVGQAYAFQNAEHQKITQTAINNAADAYPDIKKFGNLIGAWSWGIGPNAGVPGFLSPGNPAEQLAHLLDQTQSIDATGSVDGGNYAQVLLNINAAYLNQNFSTSTAGQEGAYVWMGAAVHLIEDQASPPHATNIIHDLGDNFEGPASNAGFKTLPFNFTTNASALVNLGDFYSTSLNTTKALVPSFNWPSTSNPGGDQLWLFNNQVSGFPGNTQYGEYGGVKQGLSNAPSQPSIFSPFYLFPFAWSTPADLYLEPSAPPSIFIGQSSQAADFAYNFLVQISKSLPPIPSELSIAGAGVGGAPAIIDTTNGSPISFAISENRTKAVSVDIFVQETGQRILSSLHATLSISFPDAGIITPPVLLPAPITWSGFSLNLFDTDPSNLQVLPFKSQVQFNWTGKLADGTQLAGGTYTLCVVATPSPADASSTPSQPVCGNFTIDSLTVTDSNEIVIPSGSFTSTEISDHPAKANVFATDVGANSISIEGPSEFEVVSFAEGEDHVAEYDDLVEGAYKISAFDSSDGSGVALSTSGFIFDASQPSVDLLDARGNLVTARENDTLVSPTATLSIKINDAKEGIDDVSGVSSFTITDSDGKTQILLESGGVTAIEKLTLDPAGSTFTVTAYDRAGNVSTTTFVINLNGPKVSLTGFSLVGQTMEYEPFQGPDNGYADTPANQMVFEIESLAGVASFELDHDGVAVVPLQTFDPGTGGASVFYPPLPHNGNGKPTYPPDGEYRFIATDANGDITSGVVHQYTQSVAVDVTQLTNRGFIDPNGQLDVTPVFDVVDNNLNIDGHLANPIVTLDGNGQQFILDGAVFQAGKQLIRPVGPLPPGLYVLTIADTEGVTVQGFSLRMDNGSARIDDTFHNAILNNTQTISVPDRPNPGVVVLSFQTAPNGTLNGRYNTPGSVTSQTVNISSPTANNPADFPPSPSGFGITFPPNTLAAAMIVSPATPNPSLAMGFTALPAGLGGDGSPELASGYTGMSETWSLATGKTLTFAETAFVALAQQKIFFADQARDDGFYDFVPKVKYGPSSDSDTPGTPILLDNYAAMRVTLTANSVAVRNGPPGSFSPELFEIGWTPTVITLSLMQGPGPMSTVANTENTCSITAPASGLTVVAAATAPPNPFGVHAVGHPCNIDPPTILFGTPAAVTLAFSTAEVLAAGIDPASLALYQAAPNSGFTRVPSQSLDLAGLTVTGFISNLQLDTNFQVFGTTRSFATTNPPGEIVVTSASTSTLSLTWGDDGNSPFASYVVYYASVPANASLCDDSAAVYSPQPAVGGAAVLAGLQPNQSYFAYVCNPNAPDGDCDILVQTQTTGSDVQANPPFTVCSEKTGESGGASAVAADSAGRLWQVASDGQGGAGLGLFDASGHPISLAAIDSASFDPAWTIAFDPAGNAYAVGTASGPATVAFDVEVAKFSSADVPVSVARKDGGFGLNDIPFAATATATGLWITGVQQTGGPADLDNGGQASLLGSMALWRYDFASGVITLAATYSGTGGFDAGLGIAPAADGGAWVVGLSSRAETSGGAKLAQALWRFDAQGHVVGGPTLIPGFQSSFSRFNAAVAVSSAVVTAAAPRLNRAGNQDLSLTRFSSADGSVLSQAGWTGLAGADDVPAAIEASPSGNILVAGGTGFNRGSTSFALWTYSPAGALLSAQTALAGHVALSAASGLAANQNGLWLAAGPSGAPVAFTGGPPLAGAAGFETGVIDLLPPRTTLSGVLSVAGGSGATLFVSTRTPLAFSAVDDAALAGDGLGAGVAHTLYSVDGAAFAAAPSTFTLTTAGLRSLSYYSVDSLGHAETIRTAAVGVDAVAPVAVLVSSGLNYAVTAQDPVAGGVASGVAQVNYLIDVPNGSCQGHDQTDLTAPSGTCGNPAYAGPFSLAVGTHTVFMEVVDNIGNGQKVLLSSFVVVASTGGFGSFTTYQMSPTTGPIGIPFTITGSGGFGAYAGAATEVLIGGATAPLNVWNDTSISGTIPGLSTGTYPVFIQIQNASSATALSAGFFSVLLPSAGGVSVSSAPIGAPFTITGSQFGPYAGTLTRVLIGPATAPLSVWNDNTISGTVPGLSTGTYTLSIQRASADGGLMSVAPFSLQVVAPVTASFSPSSGPIGVPFSVSGSGFGPYAGTQTQLLFDGKAAAVSVWNDTAISGTVPSLSSGTHAAWVERLTSDGGVSVSATSFFTVTVPVIASISPSSGPIGATFALSGQSFGAYAGALTQVLFGGATVPLSVWNDVNISGVVPGGLAPGTYPVVAERLTSEGGLALSNTAYFQVVGVHLYAISPATGPIGIPFTINGSGFGAYDGANTQVLLDGTTVALSVWNDASISGTIPALSTGAYPVYVERIQGAATAMSCVATFTVTALSISVSTSAGSPIGVPFTLNGSGFGPFDGANTQVLIGGATAQLSVWNDTTISGTVPTLTTGNKAMLIERFSGAGVEVSNTVNYKINRPTITSIFPSSGPIGGVFTIAGNAFGPYDGANTQVLFGGTTATLSVWSKTISGTVPGSLSAGTYSVIVERFAYDGGVVQSTAATFTVIAPSVSGISTSTGAIGIPFTITGSGFGADDGANTQIFFGSSAAPLSVWNDSTVSGSVPALSTGSYAVVLQRQQGIYVQSASVSSFTVILPQANSVTPSTGPIGASFTIAGSGFGPYAGANTIVLIGGATAPLSVWNDNQVSGTVPGALAASAGSTTIIVERLVGSAVAATTPLPFIVAVPVIGTMTPSFGPDGTGVSITGSGFGPYAGGATSLLLNGTTVPLAVWNDTNIVWTVPAGFPDGTYPVVVQLSPADGGSVMSASATFTVGTSMGAQSFALATPLAAHPDWYFAGGMNLPATQDNRIQTPSQAAVTVSSGALAKDTVVTVANGRALYAAARAAALANAGLGAAGEAISFGPEGTQFAKPVTITLPYDPNLVPPGLAGTLAINYYDPAAKTWTPLDTTVDTTRHLLSAKTSHFSLYQPLGAGIGVASAAQDVFGLRAAYVFPNPVRGTKRVTIRIQPGLADSVEVHVYDSTGRRVHSSSAFTFSLTDDLNGLGAQDTFDHVWDVSGVGSGVYGYVITARQAGQKDIHASGKIGVIK